MKDKICCIYFIVNKTNDKKYIGSTNNFFDRQYQHINSLRRRKHHSILLQRAWDKYGEENFEFVIIASVVDKSKLIEIEQSFLDEFKTYDNHFGYNVCQIAENPTSIPESSKKKAIETRLKKYGKKVLQFTSDGKKLIAEFSSVLETIQKTDINRSSLNECLRGKCLTAYGYRWQFKDNPNIKEIIPSRSLRAVSQYDLQENLINDFISIKDAVRYMNFPETADGKISKCCKGLLKQYRGYIWKFTENDKVVSRYRKSKFPSRKVLQYDMSGNFIKEWKDIQSAALEINKSIDCSSIVRCCQKKYKQAYGYIWRYKESE